MNLQDALKLTDSDELLTLIEYHCLRVQEIHATDRQLSPMERDALKAVCETAMVEIAEKYDEIMEEAEDNLQSQKINNQLAAEHLINESLNDDDQEGCAP